MATIAVIFAGGTGKRMNTKTVPKQFLELHGKPILIHTLEKFDRHPLIDGVILVVLEEWIGHAEELAQKFGIKKLRAVVAGGSTAMSSQRNGLLKAAELFPRDSIVLIHDGVRPLIDEKTITKNIETVNEKGSAITVAPAIETITIKTENGEIGEIIERSKVELARAPQSFVLENILDAHARAEAEGLEFIDSASMMKHYGFKLFTVVGPAENIKITTPNDYYMFKALVEARENSRIFGDQDM